MHGDVAGNRQSATRFVDVEGVAAGATSSLTVTALVLLAVLTRGPNGLFNDFFDYWAGAKLLAAGGNPYDVASMNTVLDRAGVHATVGTFGYSYPLVFALLMRPFALLPPWTAAVVFAGLSVMALGLAVALLVSGMHGRPLPEALAFGAAAGISYPVVGSLFFGQANLIVLLALALAFRRVARPGLLAWSASVKVFPATTLAAFAVRGRRDLGKLAFGLATAGVLVLLPNLLLAGGRSGVRLMAMLGPDPFWTNQSLNGLLSRLALHSRWTDPPLPGLPVTPIGLLVSLLLTAVVVVVLIRSRGEPWEGALALLLCLGVVAAPKNSLWNFTPLLLAMAYGWPRVRRHPLLLGTLLLGWALIEVQSGLDMDRESVYRASPSLTWLSSLALYGALAITGVVVTLLSRSHSVDARSRRGRSSVAPQWRSP